MVAAMRAKITIRVIKFQVPDHELIVSWVRKESPSLLSLLNLGFVPNTAFRRYHALDWFLAGCSCTLPNHLTQKF
jgi:hypothetical protein